VGDPLAEPRLEPVTVLRMSLDVLATRVFRWLTAAGSLTLFIWCAAKPDVWRFCAATVFTLLCHCPTWLERKRR
jgi:hypothetical protein